ncbi:MAG TPA: glycosyltransferase family 4 protein, partial [Alphaproteobacteria bacterium]|nr:glycosyltransferase family 4 protein [Alphaproteobacteria bacterium]
MPATCCKSCASNDAAGANVRAAPRLSSGAATMKIVYHHRIASKDGQAVHIDGLVGALRHAGHQVVVVGPPVAERTEFGAESGLVAFIRRRLPRAFAEWLELAYNVPAFLRLRRAVKRHAPDAIYERYNLFLLAGAALRAMTGIPLLLEVNAPLFAERCRYGGLTMKGVARGAEKFVWRRADVVLPVTEVLAQSVGAAGVDPARIVVIPNGVSEDFLTSDKPSRAVRSELGIDGRLVL